MPPHAAQVDVALLQTKGSPQTAPPLIDVQHGSPLPPHATQVPALQVLKGDVHPTPPAQHASPIAPHAVPPAGTQAPAVQVPAPPPHIAVAMMQVPVLWSQHPPLLQMLPSQHALPVPPQATHPVSAASHARLAAVQNLPTSPAPLGLPGQHPTPLVPHGFTLPTPMPPVQESAGDALGLDLHVPRTVVPQDVPGVRHRPSTQQSPAVVQLFAWQHAAPFVPHGADVPLLHTWFAVVVSPDAAQTPPLQHPPPLHAANVQQACPAPPHPTHLPPAAGHTSAPPLHEALAATHIVLDGSQQPPLVHTFPVQQGSPVPPHTSHLPPEHTSPEGHGVAPLQQASPVTPHATQVPPAAGHTSAPPLHEPPAATHVGVAVEVSQQPPLVHVSPAQHGSVVPPHVMHEVPLQICVAEHALPPAMQVFDPLQHTPAAHTPVAQHGSVAPPHATHEVPLHT